ncbi:hypothetical protein [Phenylobacterium sp.]|jgi:hypothetical protein
MSINRQAGHRGAEGLINIIFAIECVAPDGELRMGVVPTGA